MANERTTGAPLTATVGERIGEKAHEGDPASLERAQAAVEDLRGSGWEAGGREARGGEPQAREGRGGEEPAREGGREKRGGRGQGGARESGGRGHGEARESGGRGGEAGGRKGEAAGRQAEGSVSSKGGRGGRPGIGWAVAAGLGAWVVAGMIGRAFRR